MAKTPARSPPTEVMKVLLAALKAARKCEVKAPAEDQADLSLVLDQLAGLAELMTKGEHEKWDLAVFPKLEKTIRDHLVNILLWGDKPQLLLQVVAAFLTRLVEEELPKHYARRDMKKQWLTDRRFIGEGLVSVLHRMLMAVEEWLEPDEEKKDKAEQARVIAARIASSEALISPCSMILQDDEMLRLAPIWVLRDIISIIGESISGSANNRALLVKDLPEKKLVAAALRCRDFTFTASALELWWRLAPRASGKEATQGELKKREKYVNECFAGHKALLPQAKALVQTDAAHFIEQSRRLIRAVAAKDDSIVHDFRIDSLAVNGTEYYSDEDDSETLRPVFDGFININDLSSTVRVDGPQGRFLLEWLHEDTSAVKITVSDGSLTTRISLTQPPRRDLTASSPAEANLVVMDMSKETAKAFKAIMRARGLKVTDEQSPVPSKSSQAAQPVSTLRVTPEPSAPPSPTRSQRVQNVKDTYSLANSSRADSDEEGEEGSYREKHVDSLVPTKEAALGPTQESAEKDSFADSNAVTKTPRSTAATKKFGSGKKNVIAEANRAKSVAAKEQDNSATESEEEVIVKPNSKKAQPAARNKAAPRASAARKAVTSTQEKASDEEYESQGNAASLSSKTTSRPKRATKPPVVDHSQSNVSEDEQETLRPFSKPKPKPKSKSASKPPRAKPKIATEVEAEDSEIEPAAPKAKTTRQPVVVLQRSPPSQVNQSVDSTAEVQQSLRPLESLPALADKSPPAGQQLEDRQSPPAALELDDVLRPEVLNETGPTPLRAVAQQRAIRGSDPASPEQSPVAAVQPPPAAPVFRPSADPPFVERPAAHVASLSRLDNAPPEQRRSIFDKAPAPVINAGPLRAAQPAAVNTIIQRAADPPQSRLRANAAAVNPAPRAQVQQQSTPKQDARKRPAPDGGHSSDSGSNSSSDSESEEAMIKRILTLMKAEKNRKHKKKSGSKNDKRRKIESPKARPDAEDESDQDTVSEKSVDTRKSSSDGRASAHPVVATGPVAQLKGSLDKTVELIMDNVTHKKSLAEQFAADAMNGVTLDATRLIDSYITVIHEVSNVEKERLADYAETQRIRREASKAAYEAAKAEHDRMREAIMETDKRQPQGHWISDVEAILTKRFG